MLDATHENILRLCPLLKSLSFQKSFAMVMDTPLGVPSCKIDHAFRKLFFDLSNEGYLYPPSRGFRKLIRDSILRNPSSPIYQREKR